MATRALTVAVALAFVQAGCPGSETPVAPMPPVATGKVRVRVFTEPAPIRTATTIGKYTFVATDNELARWDDKNVVTNPVPGSRFVALAPEPDRNQLWILTDSGIGHYDLKSEAYVELVAPPVALGIDYAQLARDGASIQPAGDGGVWLGTPRGLYYCSAQGGWVATPITDAIRGLARDDAGYLWIAARNGLLARKPTGETVRLTAAEGFAINAPRLVVPLAGNRMLVVGNDDQSHERVAIGKQLNWVTYRALPALHFGAAVGRGAAALVMGGDRVYRISTDTLPDRPLARDTVRLVALVGNPVEDWTIDAVDLALPTGATMLAVAGDQLLVGTRDMGVARYRTTDKTPGGWFRRMQMFADAMTLTVACARVEDCWVATGVHQAWHWVGDRFVPGGPDEVVLAVARDPSGAIYALHRLPADTEVHLSRIDGTTWTPITKVSLSTPGDQPTISFARFVSSSALWIGLGYRDGLDRRPFGAAIVEPATGKVTYDKLVPVGVVDGAARGDAMWFATNEGVARVVGGKLQLWTEADGLRSELARALAIGTDGNVYVATGEGAAVWNGKAWDFPAALRFAINDVVATRNGQIWMATERGIAAWDGKKVRRLDTRRGLAENEVLDIATDQFDRVWARGPSSLTLVAQ